MFKIFDSSPRVYINIMMRLSMLPEIFWGKIIYSSPRSGKNYVTSKYSGVVNGDDILTQVFYEMYPYPLASNNNDECKTLYQYYKLL